MKPDPLAVLARLRGAEVMLARRDLTEEAAARDAAEMRVGAAAAALREEAQHAGPDYAAWLPRGTALRDAAAEAARLAGLRTGEAAAALAAARAAERAVERLAASRAAEMRRKVLQAEQRMLDEVGSRRLPGHG
ncbi:hypothetical protein [Roseomonas xinghualingensis]|uniref:hypothetical protein n=1 Tax=Roseomonas xinghualingensis TaxID=2986475 RepID=UPI0021F23C4E|nr:hypothetical protein [Roseomonas sp. SXEYE001]MCV4207673.1 hypothetical protein [Roseomonas sp. SXEYE001]